MVIIYIVARLIYSDVAVTNIIHYEKLYSF